MIKHEPFKTPRTKLVSSRCRVLNPEYGDIVETAIGTIVLHGHKSLGMIPMNKYEEGIISKLYDDWPRKRAERFICYRRDTLGVEQLTGE